MVARYDVESRCLYEEEGGEYVRYDEYAALESRLAELEKDAARYRAILENEWLDPNMQPFALREAAATKAGGMLEAVLDQFIDAT